VILPSEISLQVVSKPAFGVRPRIAKTDRSSVSQELKPVVREKFASIPERYNQLRVDFEGSHSLVFRAYDQGVAYRWEVSLPAEIRIEKTWLAGLIG
jgi:alpha-glucosidase